MTLGARLVITVPDQHHRRPVGPEDLEWIVPLIEQGQGTLHFALRANAVSPDLVSATVFEPSLAAEVLELAGRPCAFIVANNHLERHGVARLDILVDPAMGGEVSPSILGFCRDVGQRLGLRKWWIWTLADELDVPAVLGDVAEPAGVLEDDELRRPRVYVDQLLYEVWIAGEEEAERDTAASTPAACIEGTGRKVAPLEQIPTATAGAPPVFDVDESAYNVEPPVFPDPMGPDEASGSPEPPTWDDPSGLFGQAPTELLCVPISGRWVRLERFRPDHVPTLHTLVSEDGAPAEWPLSGRTMNVNELGDHLLGLQGIHMVIIQKENEQVAGLVQGMHIDRRSGTADLGVVLSPKGWRAGWPMEGVILFLDYLICGLGLRKVYFEMTEETTRKVGGALKDWLVPEVTFHKHVLAPDGGYQDVQMWSLHRDRWDVDLIRRLSGNATSVSQRKKASVEA